MLNAMGGVLSVLLMIAAGFALTKRGYIESGSAGTISKLVVNVALPLYMVANLTGGYDRARLVSMLPGLPIPFLAMGLGFLTSGAVATLARVPRGRKGSFASMAALSNTIFIGLPVNTILFGQDSVPYVLLYYIANTVMFWTIGVYGIAKDGAELAERTIPPFLSIDGLKRLLSPPLLGFIVAVTLILLGIRLPKPIMDSAKTLGSMTTPLSMIFIGMIMTRVDWKRLRLERDLVLMLLCRFILSPLILALIVSRTSLPALMKSVFLVQSMMPAMTQTPILAEAYGADTEFAGLATSVSTILSLAVIPASLTLSSALF